MKKNKVVAFVPIKLNSQRLPRKNLLPIGDKPMCYHIINALLLSERVDEVYVFCSDSAIKEHIPKESIFLKRDDYLDGDLVKGHEIYNAFINEIDSDIYVLAHTTSPFIKTQTIDNALDKILNDDYDSAFTAEKIQTFAWYKNLPINYELTDIPRTQDIDPVYIETSGFYMFKKEIFTNNNRRIGNNPYIQEVDKKEAVDIDTEDDYNFALKFV